MKSLRKLRMKLYQAHFGVKLITVGTWAKLTIRILNKTWIFLVSLEFTTTESAENKM